MPLNPHLSTRAGVTSTNRRFAFGCCLSILMAATTITACAPKDTANPAPSIDEAPSDSTDGGSDNVAGGGSDDASVPSETVEQTQADPNPVEATEPAETKQHTNRLVDETSPYLRMHAHNPVDWYPWGEEAFAKAKKEDKPIFLSVGYSSCYWCHVMERESFMDEEIAKFLNENYVCIKVDREERPDVDSIYMVAVQVVNQGRGGWPMSVFMTPEGKPFFGGTYFPPRDGDRGASLGFLTIMQRILQAWTDRRDDINSDAEKLTKIISGELRGQLPDTPAELEPELVDRAKSSIAEEFDPQYGGFGFSVSDPRIPKFPEPSNLVFLLQRVRQTNDEEAREMLLTTLQRMSMGGIWDHLGGGFHRYSVDRYWHIPHFEKMLYDNGQLLSVYSEAYQLTQREDLRRVVDETVQWLLREMRDPGGAFLAAMDAESEKVEGKFYRWTPEEVREILGDDYDSFASVYGLDGEPNFEEEFYVLQLDRPLAEIAAERNVSEAELDAQLAPLRARLLAHRDKRPKPLIDSKVLSSWNGLLIRGLADAGRIFEKPEYTQLASEAARFVLDHLRDDQARLLRTYSEGEAKLNAYIDDYAFVIDGLIALHQATGDEQWLKEAQTLMDRQIELFWDEEGGGFFFTTSDHEVLIARIKQQSDGAQPSGNSISALNLLYLADQLDNDTYRQHAKRTLESAASLMERIPAIAPQASVGIARMTDEK